MSAPIHSRFVCTPLPLHGLVRVQRQPLQDARGLFERMFCADELAAAGWTQPIAQINHSVTRQRGSVRGLHYQRPPHAEMKLVSCLRGEVWDVAVDIRKSSLTFGQWVGAELSEDNQRQLWVPPGFAHGFVVLSEMAEFLYKTTDYYAPQFERSLAWDDPVLAIRWPVHAPTLSEKDAQGQAFLTADLG